MFDSERNQRLAMAPRFGHVRMRNLEKLFKHKHAIGIDDVNFDKYHLCSTCEAGKQVKSPHPSKTVITTTSNDQPGMV